MQTVNLISILDAIDEVKTAQQKLSDTGNELKQILEKAQDEAAILKENWKTEAGIESSNQIIDLLDIDSINIINKILICTQGEITYEIPNIERRVSNQEGNNVK